MEFHSNDQCEERQKEKLFEKMAQTNQNTNEQPYKLCILFNCLIAGSCKTVLNVVRRRKREKNIQRKLQSQPLDGYFIRFFFFSLYHNVFR